MLFRKEVIEARRQRLTGEILLSQPKLWRKLSYIPILCTIAILAISITGKYKRSETVQGYLVPSKGVVKVFSNRAGVLEEIFVSAGDFVDFDQLLVRINTEDKSDSTLSAQSSALSSISNQITLVRESISREKTRSEGRLQSIASEIQSLNNELKALKEQQVLQSQITESAKKAYESIQELLDRGFISKSESEHRKQTWLSNQQQEMLFVQQNISLNGKIGSLHNQATLEKIESSQKVTDLEQQVAELIKQKSQYEVEKEHIVTAPVSGHIGIINAYKGQSISPNLPIMSILPKDSKLEAELLVHSSAIGFVKTNQAVRLKYSAFPSERFGSYSGRVKTISDTIVRPEELDSPLKVSEPFYPVTVELEKYDVDAYGQSHKLYPGLLLEAEIILGESTIYSWIIDPLLALRKTS